VIDWAALFSPGHLAEVVLRTLVIYLGLLLALRLAGKREVGQMKPFDLVTLLILSNAVQNAMVGPDTSLVGGLTAAGVILLLNFGIGFLRTRYGLAGQIFEGNPTLLVHDGQPIAEHLRAERISEGDVLQAMREHGVDDFSQVKSAVLEVDGSISVIQKDQAAMFRTRRRFRRQARP
jgi:uncharacterized membrane protein YcaP (DUF421 family)